MIPRDSSMLTLNNTIKIAYVHKEIPDDSIFQGVNTFSEVLSKAKSKYDQSHILQHQKEIKDRI